MGGGAKFFSLRVHFSGRRQIINKMNVRIRWKEVMISVGEYRVGKE